MMNSVHTQLWPVTAPGKRSKLPGPNIQPSFDRSLNFYGRGAKRTLAAAGTTGKTDSARGDLRNSILLIEHDQETAHLLTLSLQNFGYLVDHAVDGEAGLERIHAARPSIVLCDIAAPRVDGFRILKILSDAGSRYAALSFILLTDQRDRESELAGRRLGADECMTKPLDLELLGVVIENHLRRAGKGRSGPAQGHLTERERDVLAWVGRGKTSAEIAIILGVSERTVNFHCERSVRRLDVVNRTHAVARAIAHGLIDL